MEKDGAEEKEMVEGMETDSRRERGAAMVRELKDMADRFKAEFGYWPPRD